VRRSLRVPRADSSATSSLLLSARRPWLRFEPPRSDPAAPAAWPRRSGASCTPESGRYSSRSRLRVSGRPCPASPTRSGSIPPPCAYPPPAYPEKRIETKGRDTGGSTGLNKQSSSSYILCHETNYIKKLERALGRAHTFSYHKIGH